MKKWELEEATTHLQSAVRADNGEVYRWNRGSITLAIARLTQSLGDCHLTMMKDAQHDETRFGSLKLAEVSRLRTAGLPLKAPQALVQDEEKSELVAGALPAALAIFEDDLERSKISADDEEEHEETSFQVPLEDDEE